MTYLISQLWLYLLCAGLLGLLLGWIIWGWTSRRLMAEAKAGHEKERRSLESGFESEKMALQDQRAAAFLERDEALNAKASLVDVLESERKTAAEAQAQISHLTQTERTVRAEFKRQHEVAQDQLEQERSTAAEAKRAVEAIRAHHRQELKEKEADLARADHGNETLRAKLAKLEADAGNTETAQSGGLAEEHLRRELQEAREHQRGLETEVARLRSLVIQRETVVIKPAETPKFTTDAPRPASLYDRPPAQTDDLKLVKGIGPVMERILNENGCYHFKQLANFSPRDIEWISQALGSFPDRIDRDGWVGQAQSLYFRKHGKPHDVGEVKTLETTS